MLLHWALPFSALVASGLARLVAEAQPERRAACAGNTATTRSEWCDYDLQTNYYDTVPDTGVVREHYWSIVNTTLAPDGRERQVWSVNGSFPGPTIIADWGDTIVVHVTNELDFNGTGIHWHGIRQNRTNPQDGVPSVTECPLVPSNTRTYTWRAEQYGTTWWHSHIGVQAWDGVVGGIVINGPASANYDTDLGTLLLNDWDIDTMDSLVLGSEINGPPTLQNGLINGTNVYNSTDGTDVVGHRFNTSVTAGDSYRIRLVNAAIDTTWKFSIDNHTLQVIAADLVPIEPYTTDIVTINIGQRYDLIVTASESAIASDFWIRSIPQLACSNNANPDDIKGIFHYGADTAVATPTTTGYTYVDECVDEPYASLVPALSLDAATTYQFSTVDEVTLAVDPANADIFQWVVGNETYLGLWDDPTLFQIYNDNLTTDIYPYNTSNFIILDEENEWSFFVIELALAIPHPIHLHGHDFYVLGAGTGSYVAGNTSLNFENPPRRDTALLVADGYLVLGFKTDNPGAWIMHCHIGWHQVNGLATQFIERQSEITALGLDYVAEQCDAWREFEYGDKTLTDAEELADLLAYTIPQTDDGI